MKLGKHTSRLNIGPTMKVKIKQKVRDEVWRGKRDLGLHKLPTLMEANETSDGNDKRQVYKFKITLPTLEKSVLEQRNESKSFSLSQTYIQRYKQVRKMKGLEEGHSAHSEHQRSRANSRNKTVQSHRLLPGKLPPLDPIVERGETLFYAGHGGRKLHNSPTSRKSDDGFSDVTSNDADELEREDTILTKRLRQVMERYETYKTPGGGGKKPKEKETKQSRKLGDISFVSSSRMHQLLNSQRPLKMQNFYNFWM